MFVGRDRLHCRGWWTTCLPPARRSAVCSTRNNQAVVADAVCVFSTGKSANKNLLRDAKRSFCRDFKVKVAAAPAGQQQAAAAVAGGPPRAQGQRGKPRGPKAGPSQQQPAGSRGSGASGGRAGSSGRRGGSSAGAEEEGQEEEVDGVMGQEEEVEGEGDVEMGEAGDEEEGEEAYEEENGQQQQQQKHVGRVAGGQGAGRAPLQRRQA